MAYLKTIFETLAIKVEFKVYGKAKTIMFHRSDFTLAPHSRNIKSQGIREHKNLIT